MEKKALIGQVFAGDRDGRLISVNQGSAGPEKRGASSPGASDRTDRKSADGRLIA